MSFHTKNSFRKKEWKDFLLDNVSGKYYLPKKGVEFVISDKNLEKEIYTNWWWNTIMSKKESAI